MIPELQVFFLSMIPVGELRLALPLALEVYHLNIASAYFFSVLGALLPALFWLLFLEKIYAVSKSRFPWFSRILDTIFERTHTRYHDHMQKYGPLALIPFVAVPLPFTGVWTASLASFLFRIPFRTAFPLIAVGAMFSGLIVLLLVHTGLSVHEIFGWQVFVAISLIVLTGFLAWSRIQTDKITRLDVAASVFAGIVLSYLILVFSRASGFDLQTLMPHFSELYLFVFLPSASVVFIVLSSVLKYKSTALHQLDKYLLVGILNVAIDLLVLNTLIMIFGLASGPTFALMKAFSYTVATVNSYLWSKHWIFGSTGPLFSLREYGRFYQIGFIGLLLNVFAASFIVDIIRPQFGLTHQLWANIAGLSGAVFSGLWRFLTSKFLVFKK
jgi:uncharacterized membrane protein/putative flippase GtrA